MSDEYRTFFFQQRAEWLPDAAAAACQACQAVFTLTRRKHHCRNCGRIFCDACSAQ